MINKERMMQIKNILKYVGIAAFAVAIFLAAWNLKPDEKPEVIYKVEKVPVLDSILKDSLTDEIHNKALRILGLEQAYNALFAKYQEVKADTVYIGDSAQTFTLNHEWIIRVVRTSDVCSVYTFKVDSLVFRDSVPVLDSVVGVPKIYPFKFSEKQFVLISKHDGVFLKKVKEFPISVSLGIGVDYELFRGFSVDSLNFDWDKFTEKIHVDFRYDRLKMNVSWKDFLKENRRFDVGLDYILFKL